MQTYLPFADFLWSARCLDDRTLSNQRIQNHDIMRALLTGEDHLEDPAVLMWWGHEKALLAYHQAVCNEWVNNRGRVDAWWDATRLLFLEYNKEPTKLPMILPIWLGNPDFHISHQSDLLRRDEEHYRPWFPGIRTDHIPMWPVTKEIN